MPLTEHETKLDKYNMWVNVRDQPSYDKKGKLDTIVHVYRNITERKRIEELTMEKQAAEEANRLKSEFINNISHEIRTPLTSILGFAETIQRMIRKNQAIEKIPMAVNKVINSGMHLLQLINDLLDISRIEAGKMELKLEPIKLKNILDELDFLRDPQYNKKISS